MCSEHTTARIRVCIRRSSSSETPTFRTLVRLFRAAGFDVTAFPVDYRSEALFREMRPMREVSQGLHQFDVASREWIGLIAYWLSGKTATLLPGP